MQIADMHYLPENERMSQKRGPCQKDLYNLSSSHWFSGNMLAIRRVSIDWLHCSSASQQYGPCFATIGSSFPLCIDIVGSIMLKAACSIGFNLHHSEVHTFRNRRNTPNPTLIESPLLIEQHQRNNTQINFARCLLRFFCFGILALHFKVLIHLEVTDSSGAGWVTNFNDLRPRLDAKAGERGTFSHFGILWAFRSPLVFYHLDGVGEVA